MKIGDRLNVQIEGVTVAEAVVEDIEDGNATLIIPATRLVVKMRSTLDLAATAEVEVDRVFAGLQEPAEGTTNESEASASLNTTSPVETPAEAPVLPADQVGEGIHSRKHFPGEME